VRFLINTGVVLVVAGISAALADPAAIIPAAVPTAVPTETECLGTPGLPCPPATPGPISVTAIDGTAMTPGIAPFSHGETLSYSAYYMGIKAATISSVVEDGVTFQGQPAIHLKVKSRTNPSFDWILTSQDNGESWLDPTGYYSLGWISDHNQNNGKDIDVKTYVMDYPKAQAHRNRKVTQKNGSIFDQNLDVRLSKSNVQDAFSMSYFYREFPLAVGQTLTSDVFVDEKIWDLTVQVLGKERVKTKAGSFDCLKLKPNASIKGSTQKPRGEGTVWITDDSRRIPVKVQLSTPFGKVNMELDNYTQGATAAATPAGKAAPVAKFTNQ
jgi:hypothetical protein